MSDDNRITHYIAPNDLGRHDPGRRGNDVPIDGALSAEPYSRNIYYYWYKFMLLHLRRDMKIHATSRDKIARVEADFAIEGGIGFEAWWRQRGNGLFADKHETDSRAAGIVSGEQFGSLQNGLAIFLPFDGDLATMLNDAEVQFKLARDVYYLQNPDMKGKYKLATHRYDLQALYNRLIIYAAVMDAPRNEPYGDIFNRIQTELILNKPLSQMSPDYITKFMSDHFDAACRLVYHVARGEFPKVQKPQGAYNPRKSWGAYQTPTL